MILLLDIFLRKVYSLEHKEHILSFGMAGLPHEHLKKFSVSRLVMTMFVFDFLNSFSASILCSVLNLF